MMKVNLTNRKGGFLAEAHRGKRDLQGQNGEWYDSRMRTSAHTYDRINGFRHIGKYQESS